MPEPMTAGEKWTVACVAAVLAVTIIFSSILHQFFPGVLNVPSNAGVPHAGYGAMALLDLWSMLLAGLCFLHASKRLGTYYAVLFLAGSFFFTGLEENVWILLGRYISVLGGISGQYAAAPGTYYFTKGLLWWLEIPVYICLGWFFIAYSCVYVSGLLLPRAGVLARAAAGGFAAMNFDLWLDPVQVSPAWQSWKWLTNEPTRIFSIPLSNFAGWFLLIFLFALLFDRLPAMKARLGPGRAALKFFLTLIGFEAAIILLFMTYGYFALRYIHAPLNLTIWGI
jgi:uncharacterized membrane protein